MDTFDSLRPHIEDYLLEQGINLRRRFRCLNPEHFDRNPSMGYDAKRYKVHCFACGVDYDLFDLLAIEKNLSSPGEALAEASRRYGHGDRSAVGAPSRAYDEAPAAQDASLEPQYVEQCFSHRGETDYFVQRGLSMETVERFRLGFDPKRKCVVLPCGAGGVVRRSVEEKRYLNEKGRPSPLFQAELLLEDAPVFYVDRNFDVYPNITAPAPFWRLGNLRTDGAEAILQTYLDSASPAQHAALTVPVREFVRAYGNPDSERLFGQSDYLEFLLNRWCRERS